MKRIKTPLKAEVLKRLKAGDEVALTGRIYTARDAAHKRMAEAIAADRGLPVDLSGQVIYYCGPAPAPKGRVIGSCGPTTSSRMDPFTVPLLEKGLAAMIGKGRRSKEVKNAIKRYKAVYFIAPGGLGALLSKSVVSARPVAYKDLGPEAIYELEVVDFPLIVGIDSRGKDVIGAAACR